MRTDGLRGAETAAPLGRNLYRDSKGSSWEGGVPVVNLYMNPQEDVSVGIRQLLSSGDDHLETEVRNLVSTRSASHHVDTDLVISALGEAALVLVAGSRAVEHGDLIFSRRQNVEVVGGVASIFLMHASNYVNSGM